MERQEARRRGPVPEQTRVPLAGVSGLCRAARPLEAGRRLARGQGAERLWRRTLSRDAERPQGSRGCTSLDRDWEAVEHRALKRAAGTLED